MTTDTQNTTNQVNPIKLNPWLYMVIPIIALWGIYLPCGLVWGALSGMIFDAPGSDQITSNWLIFGVMNGVPLLIVLCTTFWIYRKWKSGIKITNYL